MIKRLTVEGFKSFRKVSLDLGHFNLFIGENASGKSNLLDVFRVIQGIGYGLAVDEVLNGKARSARLEAWEGIRGGSKHAAFDGGDGTFSLACTLSTERGSCEYQVRINPAKGLLLTEQARCEGEEITGTENGSRSYLASDEVIQSIQFFEADACTTEMMSQQNLELSPAYLRQYSSSSVVSRMGERGEDFAALVRQILLSPEKDAFESWLHEIVPSSAVEILAGALGEPLFAIREGNRLLPAPSLSDGTLRFAAMASAFFQPEMPRRISIEEIENGLHPTRLRTLVQLLKSQAARTGTQVLATTHSPLVLAWLEPEDYATTFLCTKDENGESQVTSLNEVPRFAEVIHDFSASDLFSEGWFETAL